MYCAQVRGDRTPRTRSKAWFSPCTNEDTLSLSVAPTAVLSSVFAFGSPVTKNRYPRWSSYGAWP